jgi:hypothetical protein
MKAPKPNPTMKTYIRPVTSCGESVREAADPHTSRIVYVNRQPVLEISRRDGKYWARPFAAPRSIPFRPLCRDSLAFHVQEVIEMGSRSAGGWQ